MPLLHDVPFTIRVVHDGQFTDKYVVRFHADPGGEVKTELEIPVADLAGGKVERQVKLPHGNYLATVTAVGSAGEAVSDSVPVPIFAPIPGKPVLVIVTT